MSLYGNFIKERENIDIFENERGFITYSVTTDSICVHNFYVDPDYRGTQEGYRLFLHVEDIARNMGHKKIYTTVAPATHGASITLTRLLNHEWHLQGSVQGLIYLYKNVGGSNGSTA